MTYIIITLINFFLVYIINNIFYFNQESNYHGFYKEPEYEKICIPIWLWLIIFLWCFTSIIGTVTFGCIMIVLLCFLNCCDDEIIINPKLKEKMKNMFIGKLIGLLTKKISI